MVIEKLITILAAIIFGLVLTGGVLIQHPSLKLELSQVDAFGGTLLVLIATWFFFLKNKNTDFQQKWSHIFNTLTEEDRSKKYSILFCVFILLSLFISHLFKQWSFETAAFDQTAVHQPLFYVFSDVFLKCDICRGPSYLSEHLSFSLALLAPLTRFFHWDEWIYFLQIGVLASSLWILFNFTPLKKNRKYWFIFTVILLSHRSLRDSFITFFREDHLIFFFLISAMAALFNKKTILYCACILAAMLSKENVAFILPFLTVPLFLEPYFKDYSKKYKIFLISFTVISSAVYAFISFKYLLPYYSIAAEGQTPLVSRLAVFGNNPQEIVTALFFRPIFFISTLFSEILNKESIKYLILIFIPYAFLFRKGWYWIFPALPSILLNAMSSLKTQVSQQFHYDLIILPFLIFGMISTLSQLKEEQLKKTLGVFLILSLCFSGRWPGYFIQQYWPTLSQIEESFSLRKIPRTNITLAANERILAQTSYQKNIILYSYFHPENLNCAELIQKLKEESQKLKLPARRFILDSQSIQDQEKQLFKKLSECLITTDLKKSQLFPLNTNRFLYIEY